MKCVKNTDGVIRRVGDHQAKTQVASGDWKYVPKSEWKALRRAATEKKAAAKAAVKAAVTTDRKKKKRSKKNKPQPSEKSNV
ncbi:hypothetical protein LCGC14_1772720 [marine sediment metagenome]|uniref:Uncharacterized protein n=1 Tax=marine sediment metagenome TaxID=412755 RepID=A0A0F9JCM9_9ZZZZ